MKDGGKGGKKQKLTEILRIENKGYRYSDN